MAALLWLSGCHVVSGIDNLTLREAPEPKWSAAINGEGEQQIVGVAATTAYDYALVEHRGELTVAGEQLPPQAEMDVALLQYQANGQLNWMLPLAGMGTDSGSELVADDASVVVAGAFRSGIVVGGQPLTAPMGAERLFVARFLHSGELAFSAAYGGSGFEAPNAEVSLALDPDGALIVGGSFKGDIDFGCGSVTADGMLDAYVAKLTADGSCSWAKRLGDSKSQSVQSVGVELGGDVVVAGRFAGALDFGGASLQSGGGIDAFVAKLDADGGHRWSRRFGDSGGVVSSIRVAVHPLGNVTLSGYFQGSIDFGAGVRSSRRGPDLFVVKLDPLGNHLWSKVFTLQREPCSIDDCVLDDIDMVTDVDGNLALTGHFNGELDFGGTELRSVTSADLYVAKLDVVGDLLWSGRYGAGEAACELPECVALASVDPNRNIVIGSRYSDALDLEVASLRRDEDGGSFLLQLAP